MIKYGIIAFCVAFYAFSITSLINVIKQDNFVKSFWKILDNNDDGILTKKELKDFAPCPEYVPTKINRIFSHYGRKADLNDLVEQIDRKQVLAVVKPCIGDVAAFTNPDHLKTLKQSALSTQMLETYDLDNDNAISWGEFNLANQSIKKQLPYSRLVFKFFDKNHDWSLSKKQLTKIKVKQLSSYIGSGGKRRK